jgi:hypothetical protein
MSKSPHALNGEDARNWEVWPQNPTNTEYASDSRVCSISPMLHCHNLDATSGRVFGVLLERYPKES